MPNYADMYRRLFRHKNRTQFSICALLVATVLFPSAYNVFIFLGFYGLSYGSGLPSPAFVYAIMIMEAPAI